MKIFRSHGACCVCGKVTGLIEVNTDKPLDQHDPIMFDQVTVGHLNGDGDVCEGSHTSPVEECVEAPQSPDWLKDFGLVPPASRKGASVDPVDTVR